MFKNLKKLKLLQSYYNEVEALIERVKVLESSNESRKYVLDFSNDSNNDNPDFAHKTDSGFDLRAWITKDDPDAILDEKNNKYYIELSSLEHRLINTGLKFALKEGTELQVRPRSGLANDKGITVLNTPGTVDSGYRGYVKVNLCNISKKKVKIYCGDRIAQGVIMDVYTGNDFKFHKLKKIENNTDRGEKGIGSSGVK